MTFRDGYFKQTQDGDSRWWTWIVGLWLMFVGGNIIGGIISGPIPGVVEAKNPEVVTTYNETTAAMFADLDMTKVGLIFGGILLATIMGGGGYLIARFTKGGVQKLFAVICALGIIGSSYFGYKLMGAMDMGAMNAAFMPLIGESAIAYALMLATFPAFIACLYLVQKFIHMRSIKSLHTAANRIDWTRILFAIAVTWAVIGGWTAIMHVTGVSTVRPNFDSAKFFTFAIATLIFIPMQSGAEEIVFRGYLNQAFGHFISNKWVVFIITSVMFAAMHLSNPEALAGAKGGTFTHLLVMSQYFIFGFILSVIVYFEDGLEAAIGVHAGNNMFAAMFVNYEGSVLPTPSLFMATPNANYDAWVAIAVLVIIMTILYKTRRGRTGAQTIG